MVIRSGHIEEKQICPHAGRAETERLCYDVSGRLRRDASLKWLSIFRSLQSHWRVSVALCFGNIFDGGFEFTDSGPASLAGGHRLRELDKVHRADTHTLTLSGA